MALHSWPKPRRANTSMPPSPGRTASKTDRSVQKVSGLPSRPRAADAMDSVSVRRSTAPGSLSDSVGDAERLMLILACFRAGSTWRLTNTMAGGSGGVKFRGRWRSQVGNASVVNTVSGARKVRGRSMLSPFKR